ncbi:hypothetical protein [Mycobacterium sp. AZCC_0083]|uniref:hypothetical protein n=1 Tax=Mycobacterium sp. AZCC_0083 TaxID=2735882 RepID=UPI00160B7EE5|nr:hypothetical protein [Mycobacterium sp. AZCC_0083]MBB5167191.1 Mg2+ and Co2+ transporter CorA [Mycobacterium sp. AZCC_0083]
MDHITLGEALLGLATAAATGGIFNHVWDTVFGKRKRKLDETELLQRMSAAFREEVRRENSELRERLEKVIRGLNKLTDVVDDFLYRATGISESDRMALREANQHAKLII